MAKSERYRMWLSQGDMWLSQGDGWLSGDGWVSQKYKMMGDISKGSLTHSSPPKI